jgi:mannose-6-phosphate isomerase-like protein (cupin superfamily)
MANLQMCIDRILECLMRMGIAMITLAASVLPMAAAQTLVADRLTQSQLVEHAQQLTASALGPSGTASAKLSEYPNHYTMIALRHKDGGAEIHANFADFFLIVQGSATLVTGGTVEGGKEQSPGEIRGGVVRNGTSMTLNPGDVVHIPATVPHQMLVPEGSTFIYFVIKVKEK